MITLIDHLINFLSDLKGMSLIAQILTIAGIPSLFAFLFGLPAWLIKRKAEASVTEYDNLKARLETAQNVAAEQKANLTELQKKTPAKFLKSHAFELRQGNDDQAMDLAKTFITDQSEALSLAFRSNADAAIRMSIEDGASAFDEARRWTLAAIALDPQDQPLRALANDLGDASSIANISGARVKLKDDSARENRLRSADEIPDNLNAISTAYNEAERLGYGQVMLSFAEYGLALTRRQPYGKSSWEYITQLRNKRNAQVLLGHYQDADTSTETLLAIVRENFGETHAETLKERREILRIHDYLGWVQKDYNDYKRLCEDSKTELGENNPLTLIIAGEMAACQSSLGDPTAAQKAMEDLLPRYKKHLGNNDPNTLSLLFHIAVSFENNSEFETALALYEELLPVHIEVKGLNQSDVLATHWRIAHCKKGLGRVAEALVDYRAVLEAFSEIHGDAHPSTIGAKINVIDSLILLNDTEAVKTEYEDFQAILDQSDTIAIGETEQSLKTLKEKIQAMD